MRRALLLITAAAAGGILAGQAEAAVLAPVGEYSEPVYVTSEPGDAGRLYVVERTGRIQLTTVDGTTEFVNLDPVVNSTGGEQGLLSVAFPPDFASSRLLYVFYTGAGGALQVGELTASGNAAAPSTLRNVLTIPHPTFPNHNGGQLAFGPDGHLYVGTGDGGAGGDPGENAQDVNELLGKVLRIDPRRSGSGPYSVPGDNPFVGIAGRDEIWSFGLRNPFRFSFDRLTGDLVIADVGQEAWEEVDFAPRASGGGRGVNWGWDCREGAHGFEPFGCSGASLVDPVLEYPNDSSRCAITGGYVVRDPGLGELHGRYLYADACGRSIRSATLASPRVTDDAATSLAVATPVSFGEDACGRVYVVSIEGTVSRFEDGTPTDCSAFLPPVGEDRTGRCGPVVRGGKGDDRLRGGPGRQELIGLGGNDRLRGNGGRDCLDGGAGRDRISAADGKRDKVSCGKGQDRVRADQKDRLRGCERVKR